MSKINRHPVRRTAAGVLAGALALSGVVATALPANAAAGFALERIAGDNRYETSAATAVAFGASTGVILASGENNRYADALTANFLAGVRSDPVLLTQRNSTPGVVLAALRTIGARDITIVGQTDVITQAQEDALKGAGFNVTRLGGDTRYDTARQVIAAGQAQAANIGIVVTGENFPDALGAGPLAYKGKHPIFLVNQAGIPGATLAALRASGIKQVLVVGGDAVVTPAVRTALDAEGVTVLQTFAGRDRSETSARLADYLFTQAGWDKTTFNVASGINGGVDALGGAALSGKQNRALLITNTPTSAAPVVDFAARNANMLTTTGVIFGGPAAVSLALEATIEAAGQARAGITLTSTSVASGGALTGAVNGADIQSVTVSGPCVTGTQTLADSDSAAAGSQFSVNINPATAPGNCVLTFTTTFTGGATQTNAVTVTVTAAVTNQTFTVTPTESATLTLANESAATAAERDADNRQYVVTNPVAGATHTIALFPASAVMVAANGRVTFVDTDGTGNVADRLGDVAADITVVNGAAQPADTKFARVAPAGGQISFTIDGEANETVVPVVFADADNDGQLDLGADDAPIAAEAFGVGGATNFNPAAATTGALVADAAITEQDETANTIVTANAVYTYDDNDVYFINRSGGDDTVAEFNEQVTLAEFEAQLSVGDELSAGTQYNATAGFSSRFLLNDVTPLGVTLTPVSATDTTATLTVAGVQEGATVRVYGAVDSDGTTVTVDPTVTTGSTLLGTTTTDQNTTLAGFQVVLTGLRASTNYDVAATQTVGGEESNLSAEVEVTTTAVADPTLITDARLVTDAPIVGAVGDGDVLRLTFDANVAAGNEADATIDATDADGDLIRIDCAATPGTLTDFLTSATCTLADGPDADSIDGDVLEIELTSAAEDRNAAGNAGQTGGGISYPLTITAVTGLETGAAGTGDTVNVGNSTDLSLDTES